jgi:carboxymethylenebutenolidase
MTLHKLLLRIFMVLLAILGIVVVAMAGIILFDSLFPAQTAADFTNVTYPGPDGTTLRAYLAQPEGEGPFPAVLMVHEFFGINEDITQKADLLAEQGYVVLAVDAYRGKTTRQIPRAIWLVMTTPQDEIRADIDAGYQYLAELPKVAADSIGAVGFCFGGTQVMHLGTRNPDLAATVIYYGSGPITDPQALGVMGQSGPVLGIYGEQDAGIPIKQVRGFEQAMQSRGISNQVTIYPGVGHAFVHMDTLSVPGPAQDAWNQMLGFLEQSLNSSG